MATKTAKKNNETAVKNIKTTAEKINKQAVDFTDNLVDETLATGAEWQKVFAKALKNGTVLLGKQQDLTLDTLEALKGQILKGGFRFQKLFSLEVPKNKKATLIAVSYIDKQPYYYDSTIDPSSTNRPKVELKPVNEKFVNQQLALLK